MIKVFEATVYDKYNDDKTYETYIVSGIEKTSDVNLINHLLKPFGVTDEDIHYYFADGELDNKVCKDTEEFFYILGEEL